MDNSLINAFWLVICAGQVFLMQAGFVCLETGLTRSKNNINVALKNITDLGIAIILFWGVGYGLMFGSSYYGWVGINEFLPDVSRMGAWPVAFLLFQVMFCGAAVTIISGATAERMRYKGYIIITVIVSALIYPVFGHWAWNGIDTGILGGWLGKQGFVDFAGSTVVHSVGGWVALAAILVIGPRTGRFPDGNAPREIPGANLPFAVLGAVLLWFGWFGFNAGSALRLTEQIPMILFNTILAGSAGLVVVLMIKLFLKEKVPVALLINGALAGLVSITANSHAVSPHSAMLIGMIAGVVMIGAVNLLEHFRIDDAVGAIPVHLGAGIWGTLAVALFGQPDRLATGLDRWAQLQIQGLGILICFLWAFGMTYLLLILINRVSPLRVTPDSEHIGLNISEHGATTELLDLFTVMERQSRTGDLSLRVPVEPFTEIGLIADRHNQVIAALEQAVNRTDEIVKTAMDGIITFSTGTLAISTINPAAEKMFGWNTNELFRQPIMDLILLPTVHGSTKQSNLQNACNWFSNRVGINKPCDLSGKRMDGTVFQMEVLITETKFDDELHYIATFRDINVRKQMEKELSRYRTQLEELIQERTKELESAQRLARMGNWHWDFVNDTMHWSEEIYQIYGMKQDTQASYEKMLEIIYTKDREGFQKAIQETIAQERPCDIEYRILRSDGTERVIHALAEVRADDDQKPISMTGTIHDITEKKQAEDALRASEERFRALYDYNPIMLFTIDENGKVLSINQYGVDQLGYSRDQIIDNPVINVFYEEDRPLVQEHLKQCFAEPDKVHNWELRKIHRDGTILWVRETARVVVDEVNGENKILIVCEDITEKRQLSGQLSHQASHDALTGLINRREFERRAKRLLSTIKQDKSEHALCFMDLDQFKVVNDTCGHIAGDEMLRQLSSVLKQVVRHRDTLARLGGDEFGVLMEHCSLNDARRVTKSLLEAVQNYKFVWEDHSFKIGVSIGLVPITSTIANLRELLSDADAACYMAKDKGRNRIHVYHAEDTEIAQRQGEMQWVTRINQAFEEDRFCLYAQIIEPLDGCLDKHYELLLRMIDEKGETIPPGAFLPAAERYNLMPRIDHWVIENAFSLLADNPEFLQQINFCSINLSGQSLTNTDILKFITTHLNESGVGGEKICFEITETAAISNLNSARKFISTMKGLGCQFALDDFGSGLSSFAYLKNLPVDYLKIDGMFVKEIVDDSVDRAMVKSINEIAQVMGMQTIAEFVENDMIKGVLREIGVGYAQGYGIGKPQLFDELLNSSNKCYGHQGT